MMPNQPGDSTEEINLTMGHQEPMLCKTKDCNSTYNCEKCDYVADSEESLNDHTDTHHGCVSCPTCDSKFQNEVQLKEHVYECHPTLLPEEDDSQMEVEDKDQNREAPTLGNGKAKNFKCRHCPFQAKNKLEFWEHGTVHIKPEKMLTCPKCSFVTEYKHHLEYHLRNHFGSKPFKCNKCSYSCVNKSMLNSHLKSHSTVYQYRCLDCSYATKYCHSLKLHLRKYGHKPATVLNPDGTPNPLPIIDVYGTRRGPRPKKQKVENEKKSSVTPIPQFGQIMMNGNTVPKTTGSTLPSLCFTRPVFSQQSMKKLNSSVDDRVQYGNGIIRCNNCDFITSDRELFSQHMVQHIASEHKRQNSVSSEEPPSPESSHKSLSPSPTKNIRMSGGSLNSGYIPLDLTTSDGRPPIEKVVDHPMMHQSHDSMNVGRQVRFGSPFHDRQNYADSNGGTDRDTTSSSSSMSPDDIIVNGGNGTKSPPPLQPINETLAKFLLSNKGALVDHQRLSNMMWQRDELCVNKQYPTVDIRLPRRPQMMVPTMKNRQSPAEDSYVGRSMGNNSFWKEVHTCVYCNMAFENYSMYTMHMGYHGYANPFKCNICGHQSDDKVSFFLHIARIAHL